MRTPSKMLLLAIMFLSSIAIGAVMAHGLSASTNKTTYSPGECVIVSGSTQHSGAIVSFTVYNPDNSLIALDQVTSSTDGSFSKQLFCFPTEERSNFPAGAYTIDVKDTDTGEELNITVQFTGVATQTNTTTPTTTSTPNQTVTVTTTVYNTTTQTVTQTVVVNNTVIEHETTTSTITKTATSTTTAYVTTTVEKTHTTTVTETQTKTLTETVQKTNAGATAGAAVIALVIGLGAALALRKG